MNYIGSKYKLIGFIKNTIYAAVGRDLSAATFCDIFAGTGVVGRSFKCEVNKVISNDCEYYSFVLNKNYIENHVEIENKHELLTELNAIPLIDNGFIYKNYCYGSGSGRQYFSDYNGMKIDAIRQQIEHLYSNKKINDNQYYFLLASLLECADKVANTASVYAAFLKQLKTSAQKRMVLMPAEYDFNDNEHDVFCENSNMLIKKIEGDILYLDPPYNERQYGANYHLLNTIARYDDFTPQGKTGLRRYGRSKYCQRNSVAQEFEYLLKNAKFRYIFLSYNNEGLMPASVVRRIMQKYGRYDLASTEYQRFKADRNENRNHKADKTIEYLHILEKGC